MTDTLKILMDVWYVQTAVFIYFLDWLLVDRQSADATVILVNPSTKLFIQLICADQTLFPSNVLQGLGSWNSALDWIPLGDLLIRMCFHPIKVHDSYKLA